MGHNRLSRLRPWVVALALVVSTDSLGESPHANNRWLCDTTPNPDMSYILRPHSDFVTLGVPFRTNELGFRDRPLFEKSPSVFRILCVGDSVTFGTGVTNEQTFPNVLETALQAYAQPGIVIDVVNAGVSAYNARNIRGLLETYLNQLRPDLVVYTFVENDLDDSYSVGPGGLLLPFDPSREVDESFVMDDFPGLWMLRKNRTQPPGLLTRLAGLFDDQFEEICAMPPPLLVGNHPVTLQRWSAFSSELDRIKALCEQAKAPLLVYSFGLRGNAEPVVSRLHEICRMQGLPHATTLPLFDYASYARNHSLGYDPHCNTLGHRLMAERLLAFVASEGLLNPGFVNASIPVNLYDETMDPLEVAKLEETSLAAPEEIEIPTVEGIRGVLAGIDVDGKMARSALFRLGGPGEVIELTVSAVLDSVDEAQYLTVSIEGTQIGPPVRIVEKNSIFAVPVPAEFSGLPVEVELRALGPVWIPSPDDRMRGASPQTLQIHRLARTQKSEESS